MNICKFYEDTYRGVPLTLSVQNVYLFVRSSFFERINNETNLIFPDLQIL